MSAGPAAEHSAATGEQVRQAPKVLLHDHLDGGLRPATLIDLAASTSHRLPAGDVAGIEEWFARTATSGSLADYLTTFVHPVAVLQDAPALRRVAREAVLDLADDGVVYAELRFAPMQHLRAGLSPEAVVAAVHEGMVEGSAQAGERIAVRLLLVALRDRSDALGVAQLATSSSAYGVVGVDLAGPEVGHPASDHRAAFDHLRRAGLPFTIHAGEAAGPDSIADALDCGARRLGHGVRLVADLAIANQDASDGPDRGPTKGSVHLGPVARRVHDERIALELCPTSNVQTGAVASLATHPFRMLDELGFIVTVNTDNRLVSATSLSAEMSALVTCLGYGIDDLCRFTVNAMSAAFLPDDERDDLIDRVIRPGYAAPGLGNHDRAPDAPPDRSPAS